MDERQLSKYSPVEIQTAENVKWFAVRTKSRCEKKVNKQLEDLGFTSYLPLETTYRIWSDRKKKVEMPLIPSVVFVKDPKVDKKPIYGIPGFYTILKLEGKIGEITPKEIEHLRLLTSDEVDCESCSPETFSRGEEVEIISGPFMGLWAKAIEDAGNYRVLIEFKSLNINYRVNVAKNKIRRVKAVA